ncbi:MAG: LamG domain-containing protein [Fibrobacter sp.]|nr:LamG domain-containing protein [Fibrobacter sp.]
MSFFRTKIGLMAGLAAFGLMACSEGGVDSLEEDFGLDSGKPYFKNLESAEVPLSARSVVSSWKLDNKNDKIIQPAEVCFYENNFAIEVEITLDEENANMTLASVGLDGTHDAWALRIEDGKAVFVWRKASTGKDWYKIGAEAALPTGDIVTVRAERLGKLTYLFVDGVCVAAAESNSTIESVEGHFTIGFDPTESEENVAGTISNVRFDKVRLIKEQNAVDDLVASSWIANWEFNNEANVGKDFTGNNHDAIIGEGRVSVKEGAAQFDGYSGFYIPLKSDLKTNEFVVEARVKPTSFGTMQNILVAEPPGRYGDGWMVRADNGYLTVHFRDEESTYTDWTVFRGQRLNLNEWNEIRVERDGESVKVFQDGMLTIDKSYKGDVSQLEYDLSIGYDAMDQAYHTRYFVGEIDYVRFGNLDALSDATLDSDDPYVLLADWEFDAPDFIGLDRVGNNTAHYVLGNPESVDENLSLDGQSGLVVPLTTTFLRNEFVVETSLKPTAFGKIQNVFVAEPPGRFGDGWMLRVDEGVLTVHFRDSETDGTNWQVFKGDALELDQWTDVKVVRTANSIQVYQNEKLTVDAEYKGDVAQLEYDMGIGYDAMNQMYNERFFKGQIGYIRYYGIRH